MADFNSAIIDQVRQLHRPPRQVAPEFGSETNPGGHRNPRPGHHPGSVQVRCPAAVGDQVQAAEPSQRVHRRRADGFVFGESSTATVYSPVVNVIDPSACVEQRNYAQI